MHCGQPCYDFCHCYCLLVSSRYADLQCYKGASTPVEKEDSHNCFLALFLLSVSLFICFVSSVLQ